MKSLDTFGHQRQCVVESNGDDDCELPKSFFWCKNFPPNKKQIITLEMDMALELSGH